MDNEELKTLIDDLRALPKETEWVEFKVNNDTPDDIGEYLSALANSACLHDQPAGYLVFGIEDKTHAVAGTSFRPREAKVGNEEIENWLARLLAPRSDFTIHDCDYNGLSVVVFKVDPAHHIPVKFKGEGFVRIGPQEYYRNAFLAQAMVNLNLIDTQGGGIKKMFSLQMNRYFPLPDYDLSDPQKVKVRITGKVIDEKYTRLLINKTDLDLKTVILLDRIQKKELISKEDATQLKKMKLIEGRFPNLYVSAPIADVTGKRAEYIRNRPFDDEHYKKMVIAYLRKYTSASRQDIDKLLLNKLSDALSDQQKKNKISNLLAQMSKKDKTIKNKGSSRTPKWILT